ncbi:hypothetical protein DEU56DRAFT_832815 [Suillus clintonianus]|uniref:uncharacterized protein n=1 Tax=Suillus clintonianus TaxID=1904413 RepID=UPI001B85E379|nr:uncharacterized protein DEU56DRAFT_832815 [Suillus clintonianus]KAG2122110.1 hypothetical protein DEU56DRAFT_832815 [Suillus clintonianus]
MTDKLSISMITILMSFFHDVVRNDARLNHLRTALTQLPHSIPLGNSKYNFEHYVPDPDRVELYGSTEAALNNVLEVTFAPRGRKDESALCPFEFEERGPGLVAVVDVLTAALNQCPNSALLQKWLRDLWRTTVYHYNCAKQSVPSAVGFDGS